MTKPLLATVVAVIALFMTPVAAQVSQEAHEPPPAAAPVEQGKAEADGKAEAHGKAESQDTAAEPHGAAGDAHATPHDPGAGDAHATPHGAGAGVHGTDAHAHADDHDAGPVVPQDRQAVWPGIVLILILTMFALAAVIGPIARMHAPPAEMPVTHSHDEPPGASHHHGSSGTINPEPDHHGHASGHGHH